MNLAVPHVVRNYQMQQAIAYGFSPLEQLPSRDDVLSIIGYGPSLLTTWPQIGSGPTLTLSGAHDFVIQRGLVPTWHADCDPRIHKSNFVAHPHRFTTYVMASCCHPMTWRHLLTNMVRIWHADNGSETQAWLEQEKPRGPVIRPGPTIGTAALLIARLYLGFRKVRLFGFDSSDLAGLRRAGPSDSPDLAPPVDVVVDGVHYMTNESMGRQAQAFHQFAAGLEYELVGDGLLKALLAIRKEKG